MSKKGCELCSNPARMFCESDQASLCWDCDEKVHAANFLVAKHSRNLLCHVCYLPTPWKAAGLKLGPTVSVCQACAEDGENRGASSSRRESGDDFDSQESESDDGEYYSDSDYYSDDDDEEEEEMEEDGENQVVPWSASSSNSPPPATTASSSSSEEEENVSFSSSKRTRDYLFESEDEDGCCSSQNLDSVLGSSELSFQESHENCSSSLSLLRPSKMRRSSDSALIPSEQAPSSCGTATIVEKLRRFQQEIVTEEGDASAMILGLCKLTRD
ncbi:hypothetical protein Sango_1318700 [Sesamum angolense]|uniref:B box-type domain-containing protein n=1 Tax=Sesamum angolense TaxID=2727404 RepID=A0AAE2BUN1_9LAMI|nr:hypothetical protein Sango_1318700 [Sesamum angolense]